MATHLLIQCVHRSHRMAAHRRIVSLGCASADGTHWTITERDAIQRIQSGELTFSAAVEGVNVKIIVAKHKGASYLKGEADELFPMALLAQRECPRLVSTGIGRARTRAR